MADTKYLCWQFLNFQAKGIRDTLKSEIKHDEEKAQEQVDHWAKYIQREPELTMAYIGYMYDGFIQLNERVEELEKELKTVRKIADDAYDYHINPPGEEESAK